MPDLLDFIPDLAEQFAADKDIDVQLDEFMENEVVPEWRGNSPTDSGEYVDSVEVTKRAEGGKGQVGATADYANIVEKRHSPRAKTEAHFNH